jgi:hypothetical protein
LKHTEDFRPELAAEVKRLLAKFSPSDKPLTTREAADLTGVSHATVAKMLRGLPVGRFATKKLAKRLGGDVRLLIHLSGLPMEGSDDYRRETSDESGLEHPTVTPLMRLSAFTPQIQFDRQAFSSTDDAHAFVESWSCGVRVDGDVLEPDYHHGDVLLVQERFIRLDGKQFLMLHEGNHETGFFIRVGNRDYRMNPEGTQLTMLSGGFQFVGKVVGCLRVG